MNFDLYHYICLWISLVVLSSDVIATKLLRIFASSHLHNSAADLATMTKSPHRQFILGLSDLRKRQD